MAHRIRKKLFDIVSFSFALLATLSLGLFVSSGNIPSALAQASKKFIIGDRVMALSSVTVRATPSLSGTIVGVQPGGALGTVAAGPAASDGYNWWQITYDTGTSGWSVENYLTKTTATAPPP